MSVPDTAVGARAQAERGCLQADAGVSVGRSVVEETGSGSAEVNAAHSMAPSCHDRGALLELQVGGAAVGAEHALRRQRCQCIAEQADGGLTVELTCFSGLVVLSSAARGPCIRFPVCKRTHKKIGEHACGVVGFGALKVANLEFGVAFLLQDVCVLLAQLLDSFKQGRFFLCRDSICVGLHTAKTIADGVNGTIIITTTQIKRIRGSTSFT